MSCERRSDQIAQVQTKGGISRLAAKMAFYTGVGLAVAGVTAGLSYVALKFGDHASHRKVSEIISQIQRGAARANSALEAETPDRVRHSVLKDGTFELVEAWDQIKKLKASDGEIKRHLADFLAEVLGATEDAEEILERPGDQGRLEAVRKIFRSSRLIFLLSGRRANRRRTAFLIGGAAGLTTIGALALAERQRSRKASQQPALSGEFPQIDIQGEGADIQPDSGQREVSLPSISDINWNRRKVIGGGGLGLVYEVAPGVVAKVGDIQPKEAQAQRYFAQQGLALPVLAYQPQVNLPQKVSREVCPVHGQRQKFLPEGYTCTCHLPASILLMPLADTNLEDVSQEEIRAFMMGFSRDCETQLGHFWDARPANIARYQGRLVALDFGEEEGSVTRAPLGWWPEESG